jgi:hypothetical protein
VFLSVFIVFAFLPIVFFLFLQNYDGSDAIAANLARSRENVGKHVDKRVCDNVGYNFPECYFIITGRQEPQSPRPLPDQQQKSR